MENIVLTIHLYPTLWGRRSGHRWWWRRCRVRPSRRYSAGQADMGLWHCVCDHDGLLPPASTEEGAIPSGDVLLPPTTGDAPLTPPRLDE